MTLLITVAAAVISTILWYRNLSHGNNLKLGNLSLMYWGASLMWLVDAVVEYLNDGAAYFTPEYSDMINDVYLGLSVAVLGMVIWIVTLLISDPEGKIKALLKNGH